MYVSFFVVTFRRTSERGAVYDSRKASAVRNEKKRTNKRWKKVDV